ncbi:sensor histidine kinase [Clostridium thermosuccinogenes]|uniref:sensor histidine kinase n=1 Tax=Clostridium thermosuccinogenes TaxID=84032 RepID=UPI000CCC7376|nr:HAMP domain-containing sensor histidine kinase [Pseudoclostridium thermosuccinogenes]PNT92056.1 histidine kinase [Pseudoclostridium thermosuccinogenes]
MAKALRTFIFPVSCFFGTCIILYFNPRLDWIIILWLLALNIILGFAHYLLHKREEKKLLDDIDQLIDMLHCLEQHEVRLPLKEDIFGVLRDEICKSLVSQRQIRDEAVRAKEQLKRNMEDITHQIKTALTAVLLLLDLMKSDPDHLPEYWERMRQEIERLYEFSDLLLKLSSLDADAVDLNKTSFPAKELVIDAEMSLEYLMRQKSISIEVSGDDFTLEADRAWLLQALINVVKNAVEASPQGATVYVLLHQNAVFQSIKVIDSGPGISREDKRRIFERFYKRNPQSPGFGIGLALAQSIVRQHGGEILVSSSGRGSEFELRFYLQPCKEKRLVG